MQDPPCSLKQHITQSVSLQKQPGFTLLFLCATTCNSRNVLKERLCESVHHLYHYKDMPKSEFLEVTPGWEASLEERSHSAVLYPQPQRKVVKQLCL